MLWFVLGKVHELNFENKLKEEMSIFSDMTTKFMVMKNNK